MPYHFRFHVRVLKVVGADADEADTVLFDAGDVTTNVYNDDGTVNTAAVPTGPLITRETSAVSIGLSIVKLIQRALYTNLRFEVYGRPVGAPYPGNADLTDAMKEDYLYISGDTPNPALLIAVAIANRKPRTSTNLNLAFGVAGDDVEPEAAANPNHALADA